MPGGKVQLPPQSPAPLISRPLKTGASFTVVLPRRRAVYRHWDKELYLPGEEAELVLEGEGIGEEECQFVIEKAGLEEGEWKPVATVTAKGSGDRASAKYKFPEVEPRGSLVRAEWKRTRARPGDRLGLRVEAAGYEGGALEIAVEKLAPDGSWQGYSRLQGAIDQGKYEGIFVVPGGAGAEGAAEGRIVELSFEREPQEGASAWMAALTEGLEGTQLQFVLERVDESGAWAEIGAAVSTVKDEAAKNSAEVPRAVPSAAGPDPFRFASALRGGQEEIVVWVDPAWLGGQDYAVKLERRALDGGDWEERGPVEAAAPE